MPTMRAKLGLATPHPDDLALSEDLLSVVDGQQVDYTSLFRALADDMRGDDRAVRALFTDPAACSEWLARYRARSGAEAEPADVRAAAMDRVNPVYIPRNHMVQAALDAAVVAADPADRIVVFGFFFTVGGVLHDGVPRLAAPHLQA